jgi:nitronate monooxygenase
MAMSAPGTKGFGEEVSSAKAWRDVWSAGHGVSSITARRQAADITAEMRNEYEALERPEAS